MSITDDDPRNVNEADNSDDSDLWKRAMDEQIDSLGKNEAWNLVQLPAGRKVDGRKWLFKKKLNAKGEVKYKSCLVEKGFSKVEGIDFGEIFSLAAKLISTIVPISIVVAFDLEVEQMDLKTSFSHGDLEE